MVPGSHLKSIFVAHRDADCEGSWSECTALCEAANERAWTETAAQVGGGAACPEATDCQPGDGACIGDTSDTQPCVDLNSNCDSLVATFGCERSLEPVVSGTGADICPATCGACGEAEPALEPEQEPEQSGSKAPPPPLEPPPPPAPFECPEGTTCVSAAGCRIASDCTTEPPPPPPQVEPPPPPQAQEFECPEGTICTSDRGCKVASDCAATH